MSAVTISLTGELAEFVEDRVASGDYRSANDVVRDALTLLSGDHARKTDALKAAIAEGIADIEAGRISSRSVKEILDDVIRRNAQ